MASTLKLLGHFTHKKCSISSLDPAEFRIFEYNPRAVILPPSTTRCTIASTWNVAGGVFTLQGQHFLEDLEFGWAWVETPAQPISDKRTVIEFNCFCRWQRDAESPKTHLASDQVIGTLFSTNQCEKLLGLSELQG